MAESTYASRLRAADSSTNRDHAYAWVVEGDEKARNALRPDSDWNLVHALIEVIEAAHPWSDEDIRAIVVVLRLDDHEQLGGAIGRTRLAVPGAVTELHRRALALGAPLKGLFQLFLHAPPLDDAGGPGEAIAVLLSVTDDQFVSWYRGWRYIDMDSAALVRGLHAVAPARLPALAPALVSEGEWRSWKGDQLTARVVLRLGGAAVIPALLSAMRDIIGIPRQARVALALMEHEPGPWTEPAWATIEAALTVPNTFGYLQPAWMAKMVAELASAVPDRLLAWYEAHASEADPERVRMWVEGAAAGLPLPQVDRLITTVLDASDANLVGYAVCGLAVADRAAAAVDRRAVRALIDRDKHLTERDLRPRAQLAGIELARRTLDPTLIDNVAELLGSSSAPVRSAAARAYGALRGPALADELPALLAARKAPLRLAAVQAAATARVDLAPLEAHLGRETDPEVRSTLFGLLIPAWRAAGRPLDLPLVRTWVAQAVGVKAPKLPGWLDLATLPELRTGSGELLGVDVLTWLCSAQAQADGDGPAPEVAVLTDLLDRSTTAAWANVLWAQWQASPMKAADRWVLTLLGTTGDDALARVLHTTATSWAEGSRGQMAERITPALALLGSDLALMLLDDLQQRYATKVRNVGSAARYAFTAAAEARGVSPDELGDRVVPTLGFTVGELRTVQAGPRSVELRLGEDGTLQLRDPVTGKPLAKLPAGASKELKDELKETAAQLRTVLKSQASRHERMLVTERTWTVAAWRQAYLNHALLRTFAIRLVWRALAADGALLHTFRLLPDGSLTDPHDEEPSLDQAATVSLAHPLHLHPDTLQAWRTHLHEHDLTPPFTQLDRPVRAVPADRRADRSLGITDKQQVASGTLRGRADRRGWTRGSVVDGGAVLTLRRAFPAAGVEVYLDLEGLFASMDPMDNVTLGRARFVPSGVVTVGSYAYDDPVRDADPRVLPLGEVPAIVYSEVVGDLEALVQRRE